MNVEEFLQRLLLLGESTNQLSERMCRSGFCAFLPYQRFIESFAHSPEDVRLHRVYLRERAKAMLYRRGERYDSEFLVRLRQRARDSPLSKHATTEWIARLHLDPCEQNSLEEKVRRPERYELRERETQREQEMRLETETSQHSTALALKYPAGMLVKAARFKFATNVLHRELSALGFERIRGDAARGDAILSKHLNAGWDLDWSFADSDLFYFGPTQGSLNLNMKLRAKAAKKSDQADAAGEVVAIRYSALVYGFSGAYMNFRDLRSLETLLIAHARLASLVIGSLQE